MLYNAKVDELSRRIIVSRQYSFLSTLWIFEFNKFLFDHLFSSMLRFCNKSFIKLDSILSNGSSRDPRWLLLVLFFQNFFI